MTLCYRAKDVPMRLLCAQDEFNAITPIFVLINFPKGRRMGYVIILFSFLSIEPVTGSYAHFGDRISLWDSFPHCYLC